MELIYDKNFMIDLTQGLNHFNEKYSNDGIYIHIFKVDNTLVKCYKEAIFTLYYVSKNCKKEVLQYKETVKVKDNILDLSHFKNEVYCQVFEYIRENYDRFKV